jgi:16S rRNA (cytidine1402-2'-O)-methyltransferase
MGSRGTEDRRSGTLYVVPTPLGNLSDVTLRALEVLRCVETIAAEDTRRTRKLLDRHEISTRPLSLHRFNETAAAERIVGILVSGRDVAYVTDAGTPTVSDPGARLVAQVRERGLSVIPLPGPSAPVTALSASGWEGPFVFEGYVERRGKQRTAQLSRIAQESRATILFEAPGRLASTLATLAEVVPEHRVLLAREMTKVHEQYEVGTARTILEDLPERVRGEVTLVLMPADRPDAPPPDERIRAAAEAALELGEEGVRIKRGCAILASVTGLRSREIYEAAQDLKRRRG